MTPDGLIDLAALIVCTVAAFVAGYSFGWLGRGKYEREAPLAKPKPDGG